MTQPIERPERAWPFRALAKVAEMVGEFMAEVLFAAVVCLSAAVVFGAAAWGSSRYPVATVTAGCGLVVVLGFGAWGRTDTDDAPRRSRRARLGAVAAASAAIVFVWLIMVVMYCDCT